MATNTQVHASVLKIKTKCTDSVRIAILRTAESRHESAGAELRKC